MTKRTLPQPDKYASCPNDGIILDYYQDTFESVYVAFHQFYRAKSIAMSEFKDDKWPSNKEIRDNCEAITWNEILAMTSIRSFAHLDVGLRTYIGGLKKQFEDISTRNMLLNLPNDVVLPVEGCMCPFVEKRLITELIKRDEKWLWVGDEFCSERKLKWVSDLLEKDGFPIAACSYTPSKGFLIATHWDSHCTFLCGGKKDLTELVNAAGIEGFFCNSETHVYWGVHE